MRPSRLQIKNFRNLRDVDLALQREAVILGENGAGKSNLVHALRLVLDPSLPDSYRSLRPEDFWDGIPRPIPPDEKIQIAVEFTGFEGDDRLVALLAECLTNIDPMVARLTYEFRSPSGKAGEPMEFVIYGGDDDTSRLSWEVRRRISVDSVHALRDAEGDLANWRRSPLRPLLADLDEVVSQDAKQEIAEAAQSALAPLLAIGHVDSLGKLISSTHKALVGDSQAVDITLGLSPLDPARLFRSLRLLLDGSQRTIADASLGTTNTIYLALKLLEAAEVRASGQKDHTLLTIEEPEAHLHPHIQRNVFGNLLRQRDHLPLGPEFEQLELGGATVLLTTHSPHIASVAPARSFVLLRKSAGGTTVRSTATLELKKEEIEDVERYLNATRAEMLFARAVLLVEGDAEVFLIPKIAEFIGLHLDASGISVCSVSGSHFAPYARFLSAIGIPFAVLTDGDIDEKGESLGERRAQSLIETLGHPAPAADFREGAEALGIFLGHTTFELDLLRSGRAASMAQALEALARGEAARKRAATWKTTKKVPTNEEERFLQDIEFVGKGRYAQRLASLMKRKSGGLQGPAYVEAALRYLISAAGAS